MRREVTRILATVLDETDCLGVGVVDGSGLLVERAGEHHGMAAEAMAATLVLPPSPVLEAHTGDSFDEQVLIGKRYTFIVWWFLERRFFVYAMLASATPVGPVRYALHGALRDLDRLFRDQGLLSSPRQRLEEPRKFTNDDLLR